MEYFERTLKILGDSISSISQDVFNSLLKDCIDTLNTGGKLLVSGLGKNVPICEKFVGTLNSVSIPAAFMHTNSAIHGDLGMVSDNDLIITLTKSGETAETIFLVNELKKRKCKIWLLSFSRESTLGRELSNQLIVSLAHEGDKWNLLPNNSSLINLIVLQGLAMQIISKQDISIDALRKNHPGGAIGERLCQSSMI